MAIYSRVSITQVFNDGGAAEVYDNTGNTPLPEKPFIKHYIVDKPPFAMWLPRSEEAPYASEYRFDLNNLQDGTCFGLTLPIGAAGACAGKLYIEVPLSFTLTDAGGESRLIPSEPFPLRDHEGKADIFLSKYWASFGAWRPYTTINEQGSGSARRKFLAIEIGKIYQAGDFFGTFQFRRIEHRPNAEGSRVKCWQFVNEEDFLFGRQKREILKDAAQNAAGKGYQDANGVRGIVQGYGYQDASGVKNILNAGTNPGSFSTLNAAGLSSLAGLSVKINTPAEIGRANQVFISAKEFGYVDIWGGNQPGTLRITDLEVGGLLLLHLSDRSIGSFDWNGNGGAGLRVDVNNGAWQYIKKPGLYLIHRFATASGKIEIHRIANYDSQEGSSYVYY